MAAQHPIILHHFPQSPFSEKIRLIFGLKKIAWTSVVITRIMPRPDLMPMTGGYRRTPVMQIGADIYCDTQCIIRELERRFPEPFFQSTVNLVFGTLADKVPQEFIADREKLRGGKFDIAAMTSAIPQMRDQFRANLQWIDSQLADGRSWMCGDQISLCDINAYMNVWYVRGSLPVLDQMLAEFPATKNWEARMRAIGHGTSSEMSTAAALEIATRASPETAELADPHDPNGRKPGDMVAVMPDDYGKIGVRGEIVALSSQHIAIRRNDPIAGGVIVHFPRAGFLVLPA
jgi:glutathione S-transferase